MQGVSMKDISGLLNSLKGYLEWNKARMTCFAHLLLGLFAVRLVNLQEIALAFQSDAKVSSRYRRLQRFFSHFEIDYLQIARWIFQLFFKEGEKVYVIIDRTNWYFGKKKINIFLLAIAYEGLAIPLFWSVLNKAGSSNFAEQKELIEQFVNTFGRDCIEGLLADREFASGKLFQWLNKNKIPFYIRIKEGSTTCIKEKKYLSAKKLFNHLNPKEQATFGLSVSLFGATIYLAGSRSERGELMLVATNRSPKQAIPIYLRRWEIESLFQGLKGRGFRFEETHLTDLERIKKLMAVLAMGFVWAHRIGEWLASQKPITFKNHKTQIRPQNSYFRYGLDFIRELIFSFKKQRIKYFRKCIEMIIPPPPELLS
jgi:Transposase DDE domain